MGLRGIPLGLALVLLAPPVAALAQSPLFTFQGASAYDHLGSALAPAGDVDQDGVVDLLVGASQASAIGSCFGAYG